MLVLQTACYIQEHLSPFRGNKVQKVRVLLGGVKGGGGWGSGKEEGERRPGPPAVCGIEFLVMSTQQPDLQMQ